MKKSELRKLAWVFFALVLTTPTLFAQGRGYRTNAANTTGYYSCINQISNLTEQQRSQILAMESRHQEGMATLRAERRLTVLPDQKTAIGQQMLDHVANHRNSVRAMLNPEQQKQYDAIQQTGGRGKNRISGAATYSRGCRNGGTPTQGLRNNRGGRFN